MGLTRDIGRFASEVGYAEIPVNARETIRTGFVDCIGVMLAGYDDPTVAVLLRMFGQDSLLHALGMSGSNALWAPTKALLAGTAAHALDYDDTGLTGHPSAVLVPAILAEAEVCHAAGEEMVAAYAVGYEIWAELAAREPGSLHMKGWHPSAVCGAVAAAGAVASLRKMDPDAATYAVGIAASLAGGVVANFGTMTKPFQVGRAAESALLAARLAEAGLEAAGDALEHELGLLAALSPTGAVNRGGETSFGSRWRILDEGINIKLYPACYGVHRILDAAIELRDRERIAVADVERVDVHLAENSCKALRHARPRTSLEAKFSAEFAMAAAIIAGRLGLAELQPSFLGRADVQDFFSKVEIHPICERDPELQINSPFDQVAITLKDGRTFESEKVRFASGHFRRGLADGQLRAKFLDCAIPAVSRFAASLLYERLWRLPALTSVADLGFGVELQLAAEAGK